MKKLNLFLFVLFFISPFILMAQTTKYLKLGVNYSYFRTEGGKSKPGLTIGFGKGYYPIRSFKGLLGFDVSYARKTLVLENRNWPADDPPDSDIVMGDIKVSISFLDLLLIIGYSIPIKNSLSISFLTGKSLSLPIKNHTEFKNRKLIPLSPEERGKFQFQYLRSEEKSTFISSNVQYGVKFFFRSAIASFIYSRALSKTEGFTNLNISDKIDSFQITMAYTF